MDKVLRYAEEHEFYSLSRKKDIKVKGILASFGETIYLVFAGNVSLACITSF
jgi:hypothetical protein